MTTLVTGATGFIGRRLARRLAREGGDVLCLVRDPDRAAAVLGDLPTVRGDVRDRALLAELAGRVERIHHCAGLVRARTRGDYDAVNAEAVGVLAEAAAAAARPPAIVLVSSLAAAGPRTAADPAREDDPPRPSTPYGESKLLGERLLRERGRGVHWTIVRPPWVYGPGDGDTLTLFRMASRGLFPRVRGGRMEFSIVHVDDLVEALLLAGSSPASRGRTYYVSDGEVHTVGELGALLLAAAGGGRVVPLPAVVFRAAALAGEAASVLTRRPPRLDRHKAAEGLEAGWVCSDERIRRELGFRPRVPLREGVPATFAWYRSAGWL